MSTLDKPSTLYHSLDDTDLLLDLQYVIEEGVSPQLVYQILAVDKSIKRDVTNLRFITFLFDFN